MEITVSGESFVEFCAEIAQFHLSAAAEGGDRQDLARKVSEVANGLSAELKELAAAGKAEKVVVEPLQVSSWTQRSRTRHNARVAIRVDFTDFEALVAFQAKHADHPLVNQGWVSWMLRDATYRDGEASVLAGALEQASRRARIIADAAGQGDLTILQVSDPGRMDLSSAQYRAVAETRSSMASDSAVEITPEKIRVSARLEVRFRAA